MAVRRDIINLKDISDSDHDMEVGKSSYSVENLILEFLNSSQDIPRRRYIIARNQLFSLYRRMKYHPENKRLCQAYCDQIKKIIQLERGNKK